jgi:hypothetical protein
VRSASYASDYAFHYDVVNTFNSGLNDGHTLFESPCCECPCVGQRRLALIATDRAGSRSYQTDWGAFQSIIPFPIVPIAPSATSPLSDVQIRIAPDATSITRNLGSAYLSSYGLDLASYNGALVTQINGQPATDYVKYIADTVTGTYLDLGVRTNSVFTSYRLSATTSRFSQRFGDFAGLIFPDTASVNMTVQRINSTTPETLEVPYQSFFLGEDFASAQSYYANNCAVLDTTNGGQLNRTITSTSEEDDSSYPSENSDATKDLSAQSEGQDDEEPAQRGRPREKYIAATIRNGFGENLAAGLPENVLPTGEVQSSLTNATGIKFYKLPSDQTVGVMVIGTFGPKSFAAAEEAMVNGLVALSKTTTSLIIDVTNNGGGFLCLGHLLHRLLAGPSVDESEYPFPPLKRDEPGADSSPRSSCADIGFESAWRSNPLAKKIMDANIAKRLMGRPPRQRALHPNRPL